MLFCIENSQEKNYVSTVLSKLAGSARDCTYGHSVEKMEKPIKHLKNRFAAGNNYSFYTGTINRLQMKQDKSVGRLYDWLRILVSGAETALAEGIGNDNLSEDELKLVKKPLLIMPLEVFIRNLYVDIARGVDSSQPANLEAYAEAVWIKARMDAKILPDSRHRYHQAPSLSTPYYDHDQNNRPSFIGVIEQYGDYQRDSFYNTQFLSENYDSPRGETYQYEDYETEYDYNNQEPIFTDLNNDHFNSRNSGYPYEPIQKLIKTSRRLVMHPK